MHSLSFITNSLVSSVHAASFGQGLNNAIGIGQGQGLSQLTFLVLITNIGVFLMSLIAALALVAIVWGGIMYILSLGDESRSARAKHIILYAILGLLIAGTAAVIAHTVCTVGKFTCQNIPSPLTTFFSIILSIVNVLLAPAGAIAFGALIYGGYLYLTSGGDESRASRAKNVIIYAFLGLAVIGAAGIVVNVVIGLLP
ncbi:MAG: hypothetical protein ABIH36_04050 [bacterium]